MASRKDNLKSLVSNSRTRVIIVFTAFVLIGAGVIGYMQLKKNVFAPESGARLERAANIGATPGAVNQSAEYAALQNKQNVLKAEKAMQSGTSSIPTIINIKLIDSNTQGVGPQGGTGGVNLGNTSEEKPIWQQDLIASECDSISLANAVKNGASVLDLREQCSCQQLKDYGFKLIELMHGCDCPDLKVLGYTATDFRDNGSDANRLKNCGFSACEMKSAGFSATQMENGGFTEGELLGAGFTQAQVEAAGGIPPGLTAADIKSSGCVGDALKNFISKGVSASAIRRVSGCSLADFKTAGYGVSDLRDAGYTAADLKREGFSAEALRSAGFEPRQLMNAGFVPADLEKAGFTQTEIKNGFRVLPKGVGISDVRQGGCDIPSLTVEHQAGVRAPAIEKIVGCTAVAYKKSGFSDKQIIASRAPAGIELTDEIIKGMGCDEKKLSEARRSGLSVQKILDTNHCTLDNLKNSKYTPKNLMDAGFTADQLLSAGFNAKDVNDASKGIMEAIAKGKTQGCSIDVAMKARKAGMLASDLRKTIACRIDTLKAAGYYASDLKNAGFSPGEMTKVGFNAGDLVAAGYPPAELKSSGFDIAQLKKANVDPKALLSAGFKDTDLQKAGFTAKQMADAGIAPEELKKLGYDLKSLKDAGFSAGQLKAAGFSGGDLAKAGFTSQELANAGVDAKIDALAGVTAIAEKASGTSTASPTATGAPVSTDEVAAAPDMVKENLSPVEQSVDNINKAMDEQKKSQALQKYQQKIQAKLGSMQGYTNGLIQAWRQSTSQSYVLIKDDSQKPKDSDRQGGNGQDEKSNQRMSREEDYSKEMPNKSIAIKMGDILFATITSSVSSDEPTPILATIVSGPLSGSKIIGSFTLPGNADKMIITFNTLSIPNQKHTIGINAYAIDPNTGRTSISSSTNHHYMLKYGSLFASTFIQGLGNAFQSADTTISIGGNGTSTNTTITNGQNRTLTQNAVIGLSTLGQAWAQEAKKGMNLPTTVQVYSGTPVGLLFMQDVEISTN